MFWRERKKRERERGMWRRERKGLIDHTSDIFPMKVFEAE